MRVHHPRKAVLLILALVGATMAGTASPAASVADKDCSDFDSQRAAQIFYLKQGGPDSDPHGLDSDNDGVACESNPAPYYYGTTLPGGGGGEKDDEPKVTPVTTTVRIASSVSKAIEGEPVRLSIRIAPQGKRRVLVQQRVGSRWRTVTRETSNARGRLTHTVKTPPKSTKFRAVALTKRVGNKRYERDSSPVRRLRVQQQRAVLTLTDTSVDEGQSTLAVVQVRPVRRGRDVALQIRRDGMWSTVGVEGQNKAGRATFRIGPRDVGTHRYRAVVRPRSGAASVTSRTATLRVMDVTPPPMPTGLVGESGDSSVNLTWTAVTVHDLSHYMVWLRADGSETWSFVTTTEAAASTVGGLTNGITYWFAVSAVDDSGNASDPSAAISATPAEPPTP